MLDQVAHLIKQDEKSQNEFKDFIRARNADVKLAEKKMIKRARRIALTLGFAFTLIIIAFVFGLATKMRSEEDIRILESQLNETKLELADCLDSSNQ